MVRLIYSKNQDLRAYQSTASADPERIYLNDGNGIFTTNEFAGTPDTVGCALGDLDGDGDLDVFVAVVNGTDQVYLNTRRRLLAYWDFDSESGGIVPDKSGYGQDGDLNGVGSPTLTSDGGGYSGQAGDKALSYRSTDQATDLNDFVATSIVSPGTNDWSVALWFRSNTQATPLIDHFQLPDNTSGYQTGGGWFSIWDDSLANNLAQTNGFTAAADGNWHHMAVVVDRGTDVATIYVDGVAGNSFSTAILDNMTFEEIHLGTFNDGQNLGSGEIDDYAIFGEALTPAAVTGLATKAVSRAGFNLLDADHSRPKLTIAGSLLLHVSSPLGSKSVMTMAPVPPTTAWRSRGELSESEYPFGTTPCVPPSRERNTSCTRRVNRMGRFFAAEVPYHSFLFAIQ